MSSEFIVYPGDIPTDNFKIHTNGELARPFGNFIEELMDNQSDETARLGGSPLTHKLYDNFTSEASGGTGLNDDFEGASWGAEFSGSGDTQRVDLTPTNEIDTGITKLEGFYAPITTFLRDIARDWIPVLDRYRGLTALDTVDDVQTEMGFNAALPFHTSITDLSLISDSLTPNQIIPEFDDNVNTCRPKCCIGAITADRVKIYNILGPMKDTTPINHENLMCDWRIRTEGMAAITGANSMHIETIGELAKSVFFTEDKGIHIGLVNKARIYNQFGKPQDIHLGNGSSTFEATFNDTIVDLMGFTLSEFDPEDPTIVGSGFNYITYIYIGDDGKVRINQPFPSGTDKELVIKSYDHLIPTISPFFTTETVGSGQVTHGTTGAEDIEVTIESGFTGITHNLVTPYFTQKLFVENQTGLAATTNPNPFQLFNNNLKFNIIAPTNDIRKPVGFMVNKDNKIYVCENLDQGYLSRTSPDFFTDRTFPTGSYTVDDYNVLETLSMPTSKNVKGLKNCTYPVPLSIYSNTVASGRSEYRYGNIGIYNDGADKITYMGSRFIHPVSGYEINRGIGLGGNDGGGPAPGSGGSESYTVENSYDIGVPSLVQNSIFVDSGESGFWFESESRAILTFDADVIVNEPDYTNKILSTAFQFKRAPADVVEKIDDNFGSGTFNSPDGTDLVAIDIDVYEYTGNIPPLAEFLDFNALGNKMGTITIGKNIAHVGLPGYQVVDFVESDLDTINNELRIILVQNTVTHNFAAASATEISGIYANFGGQF